MVIHSVQFYVVRNLLHFYPHFCHLGRMGNSSELPQGLCQAPIRGNEAPKLLRKPIPFKLILNPFCAIYPRFSHPDTGLSSASEDIWINKSLKAKSKPKIFIYTTQKSMMAAIEFSIYLQSRPGADRGSVQ
jgi:hypothetical protein